MNSEPLDLDPIRARDAMYGPEDEVIMLTTSPGRDRRALLAEVTRLRAAEQRVRALAQKVISEQNSAASEYADVRWENGRQNVAHAIRAALGGADDE